MYAGGVFDAEGKRVMDLRGAWHTHFEYKGVGEGAVYMWFSLCSTVLHIGH